MRKARGVKRGRGVGALFPRLDGSAILRPAARGRWDGAWRLVAIEYILFSLYVLIGPVLWLVLGICMHAGRRRMLLLERQEVKLPQPAPSATIVIPAKDEEQRIEACLRSALAQDYPHFEVLAIDDRSRDGTGPAMDRIAAENPRLTVLHVAEGPVADGWTGKCAALHRAAPHARGQWLLFVDSDVVLSPDALKRTLAYAAGQDHGLFSLLVRLECSGLWEGLMIPLAGAALTSLFLVPLANHDHHPENAFANGQYLLIRRDAYDAIGGHEAVRGHYCEDIELARRAKAAGYRPRIALGAELASVRMYSSLEQIARGWARIFLGAARGRMGRLMLGAAFVIASCFSCYLAGAWAAYRSIHPIVEGGWLGWAGAAAAHWIFMTWFLGDTYRWSGNRWRNALLLPVGGTLLLWIFGKSMRACRTRRVEWRGTKYEHAIKG